VDLINCDILKETSVENTRLKGFFDTVIMNPPFGTKNNEGIDVALLSAAINVRIKDFKDIGMQWEGVFIA